MPSIVSSLIFWFITLVCAAAGSYFGAYLKKKGENLATKEDIDELTRRTKEIEAKIDDRVWNRQRHWEMKREALFPCLQALERTTTAFVELWGSCLVNIPPSFGDPNCKERTDKANGRLLTEIAQFDETRSSVSIVCGKTMRDALFEASISIRTTASLLLKSNIDEHEFDSASEKMREAIMKVKQLTRSELGIVLPESETAEDAMHRSNVSSATPAPD